MALHLALRNGALRPTWAGPVRERFRASASAGWGSVQLAGTVVPPGSGSAPGHRLGFPDLGRPVGGAEGGAAPWAGLEFAPIQGMGHLQGALVRLTRRDDRSGARMRLARTASLSKFRPLTGALSWSRDPRLL